MARRNGDEALSPPPAVAPPRLALSGIVKEFPGVRALDGVDFELRAGEIHALCGENGAGKSTLLKILSGVHPVGSFAGEIRLDGHPLRLAGIRDAEAKGVALIAQELSLVPGMTVAENLLLGREPARFGWIDAPRAAAMVRRALERVSFSVDPTLPVAALGIGQQQLLEIARALDKEPAVLVLDEPTAALTDADARRLHALLRRLREDGVAILYISHRLEEVFELADRITVLRDGRTVRSAARAAWTPETVIAAMVGREVRAFERPVRPGAGAPLLSVRGLRLVDPRDPGRRIVDDVNLDLAAGEIVGLGGLMGAGRTALLSTLYGAGRGHADGRLRVRGGVERPPFRSPKEALAAGVALVTEDRQRSGLVPDLSVLDNMALATLDRFDRGGRIDDIRLRTAVEGQRASLGLVAASLGDPVRRLSGGNQQKVLLSRALLTDPAVLLLDEPTRGVDVGARSELYARISGLTAVGRAVLLASSDLPELLGLCHRILVLRQGRVVAELEGSAARPEAVLAAALGAGGA